MNNYVRTNLLIFVDRDLKETTTTNNLLVNGKEKYKIEEDFTVAIYRRVQSIIYIFLQ